MPTARHPGKAGQNPMTNFRCRRFGIKQRQGHSVAAVLFVGCNLQVEIYLRFLLFDIWDLRLVQVRYYEKQPLKWDEGNDNRENWNSHPKNSLGD